MAPAPLTAILEQLRDQRFREIAGAQITAFIPVSERLLNEFVVATMPPNLPVREVRVQPEPGDRFSVRIAPRAALLPQLTLKLEIENQPQFPTRPEIVLRMATMGGLLGLASAAFPIANLLPPGVRLQGDRIRIDLRELAHREGVVDLLDLVRELQIRTEAGRVLVRLSAEAAPR